MLCYRCVTAIRGVSRFSFTCSCDQALAVSPCCAASPCGWFSLYPVVRPLTPPPDHPPASLSPLGTTGLSSVSANRLLFCMYVHSLCFEIPHICDIIQCVSFSRHLVRSSRAASVSLQLPRFVLFDGSYSIASMDHVVFIHSSVDGHFGYFCFLAVTHNVAAVNLHAQCFCV